MGCSDLSGVWSQQSGNSGSSRWVLKRRNDGTYDAHEEGLGNARGTATYDGTSLKIEWSAGTWSGYYQWFINQDCRGGSGNLVFTEGQRAGEKDTTSAVRVSGTSEHSCRDLFGAWTQTSGNSGASIWNLTRRSDGSYDAKERGLGSATGRATYSGGTLRLTWKTGNWEGVYEWSLDSSCSSGSGRLNFSAGDRAGETDNSTVQRD